MGKKMRKKAARSGQKDKKVHASSPKAIPLDQNPDNTMDVKNNVATTVNEKRGCTHLDQGINLSDVSSKLGSAESFTCEDCREGALDRRAGRGNGKQSKKKTRGGSDSRSAIWICLQCGHFACGGVGLPATQQTHAVRHARQSKHPVVIQVENPHLRWCFSCSTLILPVQKSEDGGSQKDLLSDIVKLMKKQPSKSNSVDLEDVWFGSGSVIGESKLDKNTLSSDVNRQDFYVVRGLSNLGNTCFFNSVLQNLLATDSLRECLMKLEDPTGPLTCSLKKLYAETSPDTGLTSVINPRSLFGSVCARAPQFRGYQQQDSHELLRYLLDGLATEDLKTRKSKNTSAGNEDGGKSAPPNLQSFVDEIFGGQLSSTVCCKTCDHSSVVYEPFLDLSLPVPTKKPHSKKAQSVSRARKTKPPPKRLAKNRSKIITSKNGNSLQAQSDSASSMSVGTSDCLELIAGNVAENEALLSRSSTLQLIAGNVAENDASPSGSGSGSLQLISDNVVESTALPSGSGSGTLQLIASNVTENDVLPSGGGSGSLQLIAGNVTENDASPSGSGSGSASLATGGDNIFQNCPVECAANPLDPTWMDFLEPISLENEHVEQAVAADNCTWMDFAGPVSLPDKQVWPSKCDRLSIHQDFWTTDSPGQIDECPKDTGTAGDSLRNYHEEANNTKFDSSASIDPWKDDIPMQVGDSVVLLLPYTEESSSMHAGGPVERDAGPSSSAVFSGAGEECLLDFDGFGDMFNEPECNSGPCAELSSAGANGVLENGYGPKNISESDPDEVDDSNSPVSVESCLSLFTKPEDLTQEHAWHCENCSKTLLKLKRNLRKSGQLKPVSGITAESNGGNYSHAEVSETNNINGVGCPDEQAVKKLDLGEVRNNNLSNGSFASTALDEAGLSCKDASAASELTNQDMDESVNMTVEYESGESGEEEEEVDSKSGAKVMRDATKRMMISKLPPVLTIHLKRFSQDARFRLSKLTGHVVFKEVIDLDSFVDTRSKDQGGAYKYRLIGVVEHMGSMRGGHYVAYVRGGFRRRSGEEEEGSGSRKGCGVWYYISDSHVREVSLDEVLRCEAYILFYEKLRV